MDLALVGDIEMCQYRYVTRKQDSVSITARELGT